MQKWYNGLTKGQRKVIWIAMFILGFPIGATLAGKVGFGLITSAIALLPCLFFELGRMK